MSRSGFHSVRIRESGRYAADITCNGRRRWFDTYDTPENATRVYGVVAWRLGRSRYDLNFPLCPNIEEAEFFSRRVRVFFRKEEKEDRMVEEQRAIHETDEMAMARFAKSHPHLVEAEHEFFARKNIDSKKETVIKMEERAGLSMLIKIESDDDDQGGQFPW